MRPVFLEKNKNKSMICIVRKEKIMIFFFLIESLEIYINTVIDLNIYDYSGEFLAEDADLMPLISSIPFPSNRFPSYLPLCIKNCASA